MGRCDISNMLFWYGLIDKVKIVKREVLRKVLGVFLFEMMGFDGYVYVNCVIYLMGFIMWFIFWV